MILRADSGIDSVIEDMAGRRWPAVFRPSRLRLCALWGAMVVLVVGCGAEPEAPSRLLFAFSGPTMGTTYSVKVVRDAALPLTDDEQEQYQAAIESELTQVDNAMSTYRNDSELSGFNQHLSSEVFEMSPSTFEVLATAVRIGESSGGALDVTVGPLVDAWGFGPTEGGEPEPEVISALLERIGLKHLQLDAEASTVSKQRIDLHIDLSSLAKGFAVDQVVEALIGLGEANFMVEIGGEVRVRGRNVAAKPWRIGLEQPKYVRGEVQRVVTLAADEAVATSGDYRNYREVDDVRFSHLIDPRTGRPIEHRVASVSVIAATCMDADAWSTALMVMGEEEGLALAEKENIAALFLVRDSQGFAEHQSSEFTRRYMNSTP